MRVCILILLSFISASLFSQKSIFKSGDEIFISSRLIENSFINDKVKIETLKKPDDRFKNLKPLGEPDSLVKQHTIAGDDFTFYYNGLVLYYTNVSTGRLRLSLIEFNSVSHSLRLPDNHGTFSLKFPLSSQLKGSSKPSITGQGPITFLKFYGDEGSRIEIHHNNEKIRKIKLYFL